MKPFSEGFKKALEYVLPGVVLVILMTYSYADFFRHPYGFRWGTPDGTVSKVFVNEREPTIHELDRIMQVGSVDMETFRNHLRQGLFEGRNAGDVVPIVVQRHDRLLTVQWRLPGLNAAETRDQIFGQWFLAYLFWIAGSATLLVVRPRDERWFLMAAFDFLTAIWLIAGSGLSLFHIWYSAIVLRIAVWISVPVYLHLHWIFPRPLGKLPRIVPWALYGFGLGMAVLQWFELLPPSLYLLGFIVAIGGSLILLIVHVARQPDMHRELGLLHIAGVVATVPSILLGVIAAIRGSMPPLAGLALLSFPLLPFAYLYAAYRRQLGGLEVRVNRLIITYAFMVLVGLVVVPLSVIISRLPVYTADQGLFLSIVVSILMAIASIVGFPSFQRYVERRWLGIPLPSKELQHRYASHLSGSMSFSGLTRLLRDEILPNLLIRQFVCVILDSASMRVLLCNGATEDEIPRKALLVLLRPMTQMHKSRRSFQDPRYAWIRLVLPLKAQDNLLGFWLFGRRDPDDVYSSAEIPMLQSFADQTAVAISNILQTERLRAMYQADINHHEQERLSLARELHDSVLSELAGMLMNADMNALPKNFRDGYEALTQRLREIVSDLRPPMLNYGLQLAIAELADNLMERTKDAINIEVDIQSNETRYPLDKEQHLFRIVQEACENAVRHSHAKRIEIKGQLEPDRVDLSIADDGDGFTLQQENLELDDLLTQRHFGLAGMLERAELIDAEVELSSTPRVGTEVRIRWSAKQLAAEATQGSGEFSS